MLHLLNTAAYPIFRQSCRMSATTRRFKHNELDDTMRSPAIVSLILICGWATPAEARLFWQTYGSMVPTGDGCQWNTNSDYFVPRTCDSCRYGLYSPCKKNCATSPACRREHAIYPGYCSPYGCFHYAGRNHIYGRRCGCTPVAYRGPYRTGCQPCSDSGYQGGTCPEAGAPVDDVCMYLPNVESAEFQVLGSISLSGDPLLSSLQLGSPGMNGPLYPGAMTPGFTPPPTLPAPIPSVPKVLADPQSVPVYPNPELEHSPQPTIPPNLQ